MLKRVKLTIEGMSCNNCILHIQNLLEETYGVVKVKNIKIGEVTVLTTKEIDKSYLVSAFKKDGTYKVVE